MRAMGAIAGVALLLAAAACSTPAAPRTEGSRPTLGGASACAPPAGAPEPETPVTVEVLGQAYYCILDNYYSGATLDARGLLLAGFSGLVKELNADDRDVPAAVMPALSGDRKGDWTAFAAAYRKVTAQAPDLSGKLGAAALQAMVASLRDDHARWSHGRKPPPGYYDGDQYGLGLSASITHPDAKTGLPPLFVTQVLGGAAAKAGLRPGDVIESIDGSAPFAGAAITPALAALYPEYPETRPVRLGLLRQSTGRRWTVTLKPALFTPDLDTLRVVSSELAGDAVHVRLAGFAPDAATRVFREINRQRAGRKLSGVVLDLRGNGGGSPDEATRLLSAFGHDKVTAYQCTASGGCNTSRTDDTVQLIGLPLVVLIDGDCASACEHFSSAVKDLGLGQLVGTRTAGVISGPASSFLLRNNTALSFPARHHLGPNREVIDTIGVPPDHYVRATPADAAAGRDPVLAKALTLLRK